MNDMAKPAGPLSHWRFMALLLACFGVPVLLSLPPLLLLVRDARQIGDANNYLAQEIRETDRKLVEIKELDKTRSRLLERKQVVEVLRARHVRAGENLRLMGQLSPGLQLLSFDQSDETIRLALRCEEPLAFSDSMGVLVQFGWRDLRIMERRWERDRRIERIEVVARERDASEARSDLWWPPVETTQSPPELTKEDIWGVPPAQPVGKVP